MTATNKGRRLVLHFDINKTVVMKDAYNKSPTIEITVLLPFLKLNLGLKNPSRYRLGQDSYEKGGSR